MANRIFQTMLKDDLPITKLCTLVRDGPNVNKTIVRKQYLVFSVCFGSVLFICLLYFTDMINNNTQLVGPVFPKQFPEHPFGKQYIFRLNFSLNSMKTKDHSREDRTGAAVKLGS